MTAAAPPLAPDLAAGLRRLKLAAMRQLAPELLVTAKTQRWAPEELLRTLVEAEITARDASNARDQAQERRVPGDQDPGGVRPHRIFGPRRHPGLPRLAGMDHRRARTCAWSARPAPAKATCSWHWAWRRCTPGTRSATSPPPS